MTAAVVHLSSCFLCDFFFVLQVPQMQHFGWYKTPSLIQNLQRLSYFSNKNWQLLFQIDLNVDFLLLILVSFSFSTGESIICTELFVNVKNHRMGFVRWQWPTKPQPSLVGSVLPWEALWLRLSDRLIPENRRGWTEAPQHYWNTECYGIYMYIYNDSGGL